MPQDVSQQLRKAGIRHRLSYLEDEAFLVSLSPDRKVLELALGNAEVEIFPDKRYTQAVILMKEPAHTVKDCEMIGGDHQNRKALRADLIHKLKPRFPNRTMIRVTQVVSHRYLHAVYYTALVPFQRTAFLVGKDDKVYFVSRLPKIVKSVSEAHEALRPTHVPKGSPRQGEFFFVPAGNQKELMTAYCNIMKSPYPMSTISSVGGALDDEDTHVALMYLRYRRKQYACSMVFSEHHHPLFLNKWHRVVHNLEVEHSMSQD